MEEISFSLQQTSKKTIVLFGGEPKKREVVKPNSYFIKFLSKVLKV